tara:strand:- start:358 stop:549 length:192 start_codon:yes stop_codon:yes gene_type:complete
MDKITASGAHQRIDELEKKMVSISTEMNIQFKDLFNRVKRLETVILCSSAFIIALLLQILLGN